MDIVYDEPGDFQYGYEPIQPSSSKHTTQQPTTVTVDDAHPFDIDSYISGYSGRSAIDRLIHIIGHAPALAPQATKRALALLVDPSQRDSSLFRSITSAYESASEQPNANLPPLDSVIPGKAVFAQWLEEIADRNEDERAKLEVELKTHEQHDQGKHSSRAPRSRGVQSCHRLVRERAPPLHKIARILCYTRTYAGDVYVGPRAFN